MEINALTGEFALAGAGTNMAVGSMLRNHKWMVVIPSLPIIRSSHRGDSVFNTATNGNQISERTTRRSTAMLLKQGVS